MKSWAARHGTWDGEILSIVLLSEYIHAYEGPSFPIQAKRPPAGGLVEKAQSWFFLPRFDCDVGGICHEFSPRRREGGKKTLEKHAANFLERKFPPCSSTLLRLSAQRRRHGLRGGRGGERNADISNRKKEALYNRFVTRRRRRRQKRGRVSAANARLLSVS